MTTQIHEEQPEDTLLSRLRCLGSEAVVLAGGEGSRMSPLVSKTSPKALLTIANRPMIFYSLLCLVRAAIKKITIVVQKQFEEDIMKYCKDDFWEDPLVKKLQLSQCEIHSFVRDNDWGTADVLREIPTERSELIVTSSDYIGAIDMNHVLQYHRKSSASCTTVLCQARATPNDNTDAETTKGQKGKKAGKKKGGKSDSSSTDFSVDHYALLAESDSRLIGYYTTSDLDGGNVTMRAPIISRYSLIRMRSDLFDPHIYVFDCSVLKRVLQKGQPISSLKFDLVPYLARRQHTLSRIAEKEGWNCPENHVRVSSMILCNNVFSMRANTVSQFVTINMKVASISDSEFYNLADPSAAPVKKKKNTQKESPFAQVGERVNVTADSLVGVNVSAGNKTSVKKSVIGSGSKLGAGVKINGCILLGSVILEDGVNASNCVFGNGSVIGQSSVLKNCQVASDINVPADTEVSDQTFTDGNDYNDDDDDDDIDLGDDVQFF